MARIFIGALAEAMALKGLELLRLTALGIQGLFTEHIDSNTSKYCLRLKSLACLESPFPSLLVTLQMKTLDYAKWASQVAIRSFYSRPF